MTSYTGKKIITAIALTASGTFLISAPAQASSLYVAADTYEYQPDLGDFNLDFNPMGGALGGSLDISDNLSVRGEFGSWKDDDPMMATSNADFKSNLISVGANYKSGDWKLSGLYSGIKDDIDIIHGNASEFHSISDVDLMSIRINAAREKKIGQWAYYYEGGLQYDEADTNVLFDDQNTMIAQKDEALFGMGKLGGDYYIASGNTGGFFLGGSLSWYEKISSSTEFEQTGTGMGGKLPPPPRTGRGGNGGGAGNGGTTNINRTFGDSFGILGLYATYQFNENWSFDLSSSFGFSGDKNANSYAATLSYSFK